MIRVVLAEDHHLVRQGIRTLLEKVEDIEVVGEAADGREAVQLVEQLLPDVLLLDVAMPRLDGIQAANRVRALGVPTQVIILSMHQDESTVRRALESGALGYVLKGSVYEELLLAIRAAVRGDPYLAPAIAAIVVDQFLNGDASARQPRLTPRLTPREREVLQLIAEGHKNAGVAESLGISIRTVERHRANIHAKMGANDLTSLLREARRYGFLFSDPQP